jgi:hypothetical protein
MARSDSSSTIGGNSTINLNNTFTKSLLNQTQISVKQCTTTSFPKIKSSNKLNESCISAINPILEQLDSSMESIFENNNNAN